MARLLVLFRPLGLDEGGGRAFGSQFGGGGLIEPEGGLKKERLVLGLGHLAGLAFGHSTDGALRRLSHWADGPALRNCLATRIAGVSVGATTDHGRQPSGETRRAHQRAPSARARMPTSLRFDVPSSSEQYAGGTTCP